jgi:hypothetical protein
VKSLRIFLYGIVALFFILLSGENAFACKCSNPPTVEQSFEQSAAVFYGKVESVKSDDREMVAVFRVEKSWKGADNDVVVVRTDTSSCGINFKEGDTHYLFVDKKDDDYQTVVCRRHGGSQEKFLENKPTIELKSVPLAPQPVLNTTPKPGEKHDMTQIETKPFSRDAFLIITSSVISALVVLTVVVIGFFILRSRNR